MDAELTAAARALDAGDVLGALQRVALRDDAPALAMRAVALARLGKFERARELLKTAAQRFGSSAPRERARCLLADAEIAFASRDLRGIDSALASTREALAHHGDRTNALHAQCLAARAWLLRGHSREAESLLSSIDLRRAPAMLEAEVEIARTELYVRELRLAEAETALLAAERAARRAGVPALLHEVGALRARLQAPAARLLRSGIEQVLGLPELESLSREPRVLLVDARSLRVGGATHRVALSRRPILFALARVLAEAWPGSASRSELLLRAFSVRRGNDSHRARLRVEMGRLRRALGRLVELRATETGFELVARGADDVVVLAPLLEVEHADVLALLGDGEAWSSSALASALERSQRSVQRALLALEATGRLRATGLARARRWLLAPDSDFATHLLLPRILGDNLKS